MRLLDRYLLRELLMWLGYCLGGLLILVIAFDLIQSLNRIQEHQLLIKDIVELYIVKIPRILVFPILPITLLIALLFALTQHTRHHELIAMRAAGVSLWRLCVPYLVVGLLLSLAAFAMNELLVPDSQAREDEIMDRRLREHALLPPQTTSGFPNTRDGRKWVWDGFNFDTDVMTNPKVEWIEHGETWLLHADRAERIDGVWTFFGSPNFSTNDVISFDSLALKLKQPTNAIAQFVSSQLSQGTQDKLAHYTNGPNHPLERALVADLNRMVRHGPIYDPQRFAGVKLAPELLEQSKKRGTELVLYNRALLIEAFPKELSPTSLNTVEVKRKDAPVFQTITNMLVMPQFTETPQNFATEAKFNARFQTPTADSVGVPIREILSYVKLHPDLSQKNRSWLYTQLHGRFAEPWSSLVVVLIAIPFGAASGRRNIFVGVAGSIVLVFVYFILFRLGLALGTGGLLPAWIAAWLPNAVFGVAGIWMMMRVR